MSMTRIGLTLTCGLAVAGVVALGAQSSETQTKTKVEVQSGKDMKVTGCVKADPAGGYMLTEVAAKGQQMHRYTLVSDKEDFRRSSATVWRLKARSAIAGTARWRFRPRRRSTVRPRTRIPRPKAPLPLSA